MKKIFLIVLILMISSVCFAGPSTIPPTTGSGIFSVTDITGATDATGTSDNFVALRYMGSIWIEQYRNF